jgi:hypothetical protein
MSFAVKSSARRVICGRKPSQQADAEVSNPCRDGLPGSRVRFAFGEDRVAGQSCLICVAPIRPGEAVSFQDGELVHMACYNGQSQATRRRKETTYKGHTIRLYCYPVMGQWRPIAVIEFPV